MIKIQIYGDYSPYGRINASIEQNRYDSFLQEIKDLNSNADYSIINFESTVADNSDLPIRKLGPNLKCTSKSLEALKWAGFDMVTLANNHFYDYGESGITKSFEAIKTSGLDYVGAGMNAKEAAQTCFKIIRDKQFAFINCCEHEFSIASDNHGGSNALNPIQQYYAIKEARAKADYIIVIVHGGHEHFQLPSIRMKETYRFFIDAGADAVINHHQHCYSGYEFYKNKPIVYGLGNLCFDEGPKENKKWHEGYVAELIFSDHTIELKLHPYEQCNLIPNVHFIKDQSDFNKNIDELNKIIQDNNLLQERVSEFYSQTGNLFLRIFEPILNRFLAATWSRGLLPSTFIASRILAAQNYIQCESHLDRLRFAIRTKFKAIKK